MQLRSARLCLDCEELHEAQVCPICASESFAYLSRWVNLPNKSDRSRPFLERTVDHERLDALRMLTSGQVVTSGVLGITTLGLLGLWWQRRAGPRPPEPDENGGGPNKVP